MSDTLLTWYQRLERHNLGKVNATRNKGPWAIVYYETYSSRIEANNRELHIKSDEKQDLHRETY